MIRDFRSSTGLPTRARRLMLPLMIVAALASTFAVGAASADTVTRTVPGMSNFNGLACSSATNCLGVGGGNTGNGDGEIVSVVNGVPGPIETVPGVSTFLNAVCPTSSFCLADALAPSDGSLLLVSLVQGGVQQILNTGVSLHDDAALACPTTTTCLILTHPNVIIVHIAADGTMSTSTGAPLSADDTINGVSCYSATACIAVGSVLTGTNLTGIMVPLTNAVPGTAVQVNGTYALEAVGCASSGPCLAGGRGSDPTQGVLVPVTLGGAGALLSTGSFISFGIACPTASECVEAGNDMAAQSTAGGVVESQTPLTFLGLRVACPTTTACLVSGQDSTFTANVVTLAAAATPSRASVTFAPQRIGTTSTASSLTVTNTGNAPLSFSSVAIKGTGAAVFKITSNSCTGMLAPGAHCSTAFTFRPTADKTFSASVTYTDNAPGLTQTVPLSGRGCLVLSGTVCF